MKTFLNRLSAGTLVVAIAGALSVAPSLASERTPARPSLARVTPAEMQALMKSAAPVKRQEASSPGSFFRTKKGGIALALVAAGVGFSLWSIRHDRKPVKSPVR